MTNTEKIKEIRNENPTKKASEIAKELGLTRERVRQILNSLGLPTRFLTPLRICLNEKCVNEITRTSKAKTCSPLCFYEHHREIFKCAYCGEAKMMLKTILAIQRQKYTNTYCSKPCRSRGIWVGRKEKIPI